MTCVCTVRDWRGELLYEGCRVVFAYDNAIEEATILEVMDPAHIRVLWLATGMEVILSVENRLTRVDVDWIPDANANLR